MTVFAITEVPGLMLAMIWYDLFSDNNKMVTKTEDIFGFWHCVVWHQNDVGRIT